jgi:hypothetical protein
MIKRLVLRGVKQSKISGLIEAVHAGGSRRLQGSLDNWRGALWEIYAPKVVTELSPGFQPGFPWEPSK